VAQTDDVLERTIDALRAAGASFALLFGSRSRGEAGEGSDIDVAAWWPGTAPAPWAVDVPDQVDLVVLDRLPLELAGRIALEGTVLFDNDPAARVAWVARTRKIWLDERPRVEAAHHLFLKAVTRGR
jgi:predicted nucleotidyltransferase